MKAFAKVNLALFITNRLPNGYHTLETVFAPINWFDELRFEPSERLEITCSEPDIPADDSNLCLRAAKLLRDYTSTKDGVRIHLEKHIPHGAGLGGGSSDAALTLKALNELWQLGLSPEKLGELAVSLGADVPYFLSGSALVYATGIGEVLLDLETTFPAAIVVAFPKVRVSTKWAYQNLRLQFPRTAPDLKALTLKLCASRDLDILQRFENDFEPTVFAAFPTVKKLKDIFYHDVNADFALMSGSGSAVFGVYEHLSRAEEVARQLAVEYAVSLTPPCFSPREAQNQTD